MTLSSAVSVCRVVKVNSLKYFFFWQICQFCDSFIHGFFINPYLHHSHAHTHTHARTHHTLTHTHTHSSGSEWMNRSIHSQTIWLAYLQWTLPSLNLDTSILANRDSGKIFEPAYDKTYKMACAPSEDSDQPGHPPSLIRVFAVHMKKPFLSSDGS